MRRALALISVAAGLAGCAPTGGAGPDGGSQVTPAGSSARQCFQASRIQNYTRGGTDRIYIRVLGGGVFGIQSAGCSDFGVTPSLSIAPASGVGDRLCAGDSARIVLPSGSFGPGQCLARVGNALSAAEIEALPPAQRP
jgi:hypothetical protein